MRDFYPEDLALRNAVFSAWNAAARRFGFSEYDACVVESLDLLQRKAGEEIVEQIYTFKDKSDRDLALRPEMTPTLARMVAARHGALHFPLKWYCIAQCFRYERTTRGRKREHYQWNLDIVGEGSVAAEAEVVAAAAYALSLLGLRFADYRIAFSSRSLLADLLSTLGIDAGHHAVAFLALDKRGKIPDSEIKALLTGTGVGDAQAQKIFDLLNLKSLEEVRAVLKGDTAAYRQVIGFRDLLAHYGLSDVLEFDISVVRGLAYYTGIVFEAYDKERKYRAMFGGGRYDNLLKDIGGAPATGVGLGFGDVVIAEILAGNRTAADVRPAHGTALAFMDEAQRPVAMRIAAELRREGKHVDLFLNPDKAKRFFARAAKRDFQEAVFIGPDDVEKGTFRLKDLRTREELVLQIAQPE